MGDNSTLNVSTIAAVAPPSNGIRERSNLEIQPIHWFAFRHSRFSLFSKMHSQFRLANSQFTCTGNFCVSPEILTGLDAKSSRGVSNREFPSLFPSYREFRRGDSFAKTASTTTHSGDRGNFLGSSEKSHLLGHFCISAPAIPVSEDRKDGNSRVLAVRSLALAKPFPGSPENFGDSV